MLPILITDHIIEFNYQVVSPYVMHKVHSGDLHYSVVMLTDVVAKAGGYSLTDMHVMKSQAIL